MKSAYGKLAAVWLALLVLLFLSFGSAYLHLGVWNGVANLAIAAMKAALVALVFMKLHEDQPVLRLTALVALFTLTVLFSLSVADYATRIEYPAPWQAPAR